MEEGDKQDDNTERLDEIKESKGPGIIPTIDMEECVDDDKDDSTEILNEEKGPNTILVLIWRKVYMIKNMTILKDLMM